jgi:hypothetical protein
MAETGAEGKCSCACYILAFDASPLCPLTLAAMGMTRKTGMELFRRLARIVTIVVTVAYLLPALLTALPSPASAEEQALYADLMKSRCVDTNGDGEPDSGLPAHGAHDCCILCAAPQSLAPRIALQVPVEFSPRPGVVAPKPVLAFAVPPSEAVFRPVSQRDPPA